MKKYAPLLAAAGLVLAGAGCMSSTTTEIIPPAPAPAPAPAQQPPAAVQGRAVYSITDAAADMKGVTSVMITIDKIETHNATSDWVTVSQATHTYDLLQLKATGSAALLADANLDVGTYDQVRIHVVKVEVTADGKTTEAKLPSNTLQLKGTLTVKAGETASAQLDFMADKSLHLTGSGKYILSPVVRLLVMGSADVKVDADEKVKVDAGASETDETDGMDEKGDMQKDFELKGNLDLDAQGMVKVRD